jgi:hypothetical protein
VGDPSSISSILWTSDPSTQRAIWFVIVPAAISAIAVFGPLILRLGRLYLLERHLRDLGRDRDRDREHLHSGSESNPIREAMLASPVQEVFEEFERRWTTSQLTETQDRAPIRLMDVFDDRPLLPYGPRRSLLPVLPGLFLGLGVFAALTGLIPSLTSPDAGREAGWMAAQLGLALRASAWGFLCAIGASLTGRLLEGGFVARSAALDALMEANYRSVSPGELAEITRQTQQQNLNTLGKELGNFANELNERLDRGLQRIEQSTARSASLISQEQRGALHTIVQELSLSVRQGVEHHLGELRGALQSTIEHQASVTGGIAETFERMVENSHTQDRVARILCDAAQSVEEASVMMRGSAGEMKPVLKHLSATSQSLADTATRINDSQQLVARTADEVRSSLEHTARGAAEQRQFIELSLAEIRRSLTGLGDGLGGSLQRSLREIDDVLSSTVGQLRDTLAESQRLQGARSELGARPVSPFPPRKDRWPKLPASPPQDLDQTRLPPSNQRDAGDTPSVAITPASPSQFDGGSPTRRTVPETPPRGPAGHVRENADASSSDSTGRDLAVSGYRTGAPRAQGPDPYERFDAPAERPSNVTVLATHDRKLGDPLNLSGLLGPRGGSSGRPPKNSEDQPAAKRSPKPATDGSE